jgi:dsDNA-binding SOS-regulon protein
MKALINKLSSEIYSNIIIDERQLKDGIIEDGYMYQELKQGFDNWIKLCIKLDEFKQYFDTLDKQKQEQLKQGLKLLSNAPFIEDDNIAKEFHLFLANHKLSQLAKFKEKKLMELKLPNVNTQEIAKDIHKFTKFRYNTKL